MSNKSTRRRADAHAATRWAIPTQELADSAARFRIKLAWLAGYDSARRELAAKRRREEENYFV